MPELYFHAVNAGYKTATLENNFDFFELRKTVPDKLLLNDYTISYEDATHPPQELGFYDHQLESEMVYIGHRNSPQFQTFQLNYLHDFGDIKTGMDPAGGKLQLWKLDQLVDEVCWGENFQQNCRASHAAFASEEESNASLLRNISVEHFPFVTEKYYPSDQQIRAVVLTTLPMGDDGNMSAPAPEPEPDPAACANLEITEYLTYFEEDMAEQFVEIHNTSNQLQNLNHCVFVYNDARYALQGSLLPDQYFALEDLPFGLYKNPSSEKNIFKIEGENGHEVATLPQAPKQTQGTSCAKFMDEQGQSSWKRTYRPTPSAPNIFQEFHSCPAGQEINPETGRCRKIPEPEPEPKPQPEVKPNPVQPPAEPQYEPCAAGWYRHPETHRCRKIPVEEEPKPCAAGWYRNPETGRCRKIVVEQPPAACPAGQYRNPETGRCKKIQSDSSPAPCDAGYERNPETGRCRKIPTEPEYKPCAEGYERNPETHRCRKIQTNSGQEYPVEPTPPTEETGQKYPNFGNFTAVSALVGATMGGAAMIALQFKDKLAKSIMNIWPRKKS